MRLDHRFAELNRSLCSLVAPADRLSCFAIEYSRQSAPLTSRDENESLATETREHHSACSGSALQVECVHAAAAGAYIDQWKDLAGRCLEANVFMEPAFALPAARHLDGRRLAFLFVWDRLHAGVRGSLIAVCALQPPGAFYLDFFARSWVHKQSTLGMPLLDRARADEALEAILVWQQTTHPYLAGVMFPKLPLCGPTFAVLSHGAARHNRLVRIMDKHDRAVLRQTQEVERFLLKALSPSRRKSLANARRRLEAKGSVTFWLSSDANDARTTFEEFLGLEGRGWKGRRGTALNATSDTATFAREMVTALAQEHKCRIAKLDFNGHPIALGVLLISGANAFFWKIAYDEEFAQFSPGVQLSYELSRALLQDSGIAFTDSCACANHPMIDRIWPQKMAMGDVLVSGAVNRQFFMIALIGEYLRRAARERLKEMRNGLRRMWREQGIKHPA